MIYDDEQEINLEENSVDTSLAMPDLPDDEQEDDDNEIDMEANEAAFEEEETYNKKVDEGEWSSQDLTNIAAGAGAGVARAFTGTLSLAADLVDIGAETAGFEGFSDKTLQNIHSTLDLSDNIAELTGANENADAFKTSRAISEGITIGLQMMMGIGAVSAGAKVSKALLKKGGVKGAGKLIGKGAKAVTKGSKAEVAGKTAAAIGGEELLSTENANEGGFIIDTFLRDAQESESQADSIHEPIMGIINRADPELAIMIDEYSSVNPRNERDAFDRLQGRLEGVVDGLVAGGVLAIGAKTLGKYFKAYKQTKYNASAAKDFKVDEAFIANKVQAAALKGDEVTDEVMEAFKIEAKEARKAAQSKTFDEVSELYEKKIFGKTGILEEVRKKVDDTASFFEDENIAGVFNRMASGAVPDEDDLRVITKLARANDKIAKLTGKKKEFFLNATSRDIAEVMQDEKFLNNVQKKFATDRLLVTDQRVKLSEEMGEIKTQIASFMKETGEVPSRLLLSQQAIISADSALDLKGSAMNSLSGQFLRLAKDDKGHSISSINRFINNQKKIYKTDVDFAQFEAKMYADKEFRASRMGEFSEPTKLMKSLDLMSDFYRQHLLTSVKGVVRNVSEGVVLSGVRMARDVIADPRNVRAIRSTFNRDNTNIAMARFKHAMKGGSDYDDATKLGASLISEHASISDGLKGKILKATSMGRRSVVAGDKLISTYNEAYYMNKNIMNNMDELITDSQGIETLAKKLATNDSLTIDEVTKFNSLRAKGIDPVNFIKNIDSQGFEGAMDFALSSMQKNPALIKESKKYADKIAMNMDIDDLGFLAKSFSKTAIFLGDNPATRMFMPFPRPALSALDETMEWTPLMNLPRLAKRISEGSPRERREAVVQMGMTLSGGAAIWGLYSEGILTGSGPKEIRANKAWRSFNQPNTINIGGKAISVQGTVLGAIGSIIGEAHDIMETHDDGSIEATEKKELIMAGVMSAISDVGTSFWTDSLDPLLRGLKPQGEKSLESAKAAVITNLVKSMPVIGLGVQGLSQINSGIDGDKADTATRTGKEPFERAWNDFKKNMPLMDVPKRVSFITGENLESGNTLMKPVLSLASFKGTEFKDVGSYINALIQESGAKNSRSTRNYLRFTEPERSISLTDVDKVSYKLSADEYEELTRLTSQPSGYPPMVEAIRDIMKEMPLDGMETQQDKDFATSLINQTMSEYKKAAREEFKEVSDDFNAWSRDQVMKEQDRQNDKARLNI